MLNEADLRKIPLKSLDTVYGICHLFAMPRPQTERRISCRAASTYFKPRGIPMRELESVELAADELEAIRLTDLEGMYQEQAAEQMGVSRQTLGNILKRAHKKVAEALVLGKAIGIQEHTEDTSS
jgi:predicted DNA-binding protein (UPF0251 family)